MELVPWWSRDCRLVHTHFRSFLSQSVLLHGQFDNRWDQIQNFMLKQSKWIGLVCDSIIARRRGQHECWAASQKLLDMGTCTEIDKRPSRKNVDPNFEGFREHLFHNRWHLFPSSSFGHVSSGPPTHQLHNFTHHSTSQTFSLVTLATCLYTASLPKAYLSFVLYYSKKKEREK